VRTRHRCPGTSEIENAQVAVYLTDAGAAGHALIDRELYRPRVWADDTARRDQAGVPAEVTFATKPALATEMITRALDAGIGARWVTGDEVYGGDPKLRETLEDRGIGYVLAVACSHQVRTGAGKIRADELAASLPRRAWQRLSAGVGFKGPQFYDWAWISIEPHRRLISGQWWLLVRCNNASGGLAFYRCWSPPCHCARWSASPAAGGRSKNRSKPPRPSPGSISTRSAAGPAGTAGLSSPCSPTPCSPSSLPPNAPEIQHHNAIHSSH
jgi:hypothetical protein